MRKLDLAKIVLVCMLSYPVFSCKKSSDATTPVAVSTVQPTGELASQLQLSKANLAARSIDASIVSYEAAPDLNDDSQLAAVKQKLLAGDNMVPQFDGISAGSFKVSTIKERMADFRANPDDQQNVVQNLQQVVFPTIQKGQKVMTILWKANGQLFRSTCIYDSKGVVYDNMLSNIALTEAATPPLDEQKLSGADLRTNTAQSAKQYSFTATARNVTIKWLWGSTRGKVVIKHYIIWNGYNYIYDHGGSVDAWMSIGSASGRWANNYLNRRSRSKMSWGYGWATPTASFSIKFNSKNITFSASTSGVGSKGSGDGIHTIYF